MKGRKPKPTALKVLEGTARPDRANPREPRPGRPPTRCPQWLEDPVARREWRKLAPMLARIGVFRETDALALALLCQQWAAYQHEPSSAKTRVLLALFAEFGLTPASRTRIVAADDDERDELEEFLGRSR